ncbi:MAG: hypothetical protein ACYDHT_12340 [Solirubrobacteraceae bacterium]
MPGTTSPGVQGLYYCWNSATFNRTITAAGATNPRVDTIVARVKDEAYAGAANEWVIEAVKGAEEAGATLANRKGVAAVPASSLVLAYVLVPANATSIVTADIENVAPLMVPEAAPPVVTAASNFTAESGRTYLMSAGVVATMPAPVRDFEATFWQGGGTGTLKLPSGGFFGDFVKNASTLTLNEFQHVTIQSDGSNYIITAGEPKREQAYETKTFTKAEYEAGVVLSATRPVFVNQKVLTGGGGTPGNPQTIGGVEATHANTWVPPGAILKMGAGGSFTTATLTFVVL